MRTRMKMSLIQQPLKVSHVCYITFCCNESPKITLLTKHFFAPLGTLYCATRSYTSKKKDEISLSIGAVVEVLLRSDNGWWLVR